MATSTKRHYSREFRPAKKGKDLAISDVPRQLFISFKAKVERENLSMRALILSWIRNWTAGRRPDEDGPE